VDIDTTRGRRQQALERGGVAGGHAELHHGGSWAECRMTPANTLLEAVDGARRACRFSRGLGTMWKPSYLVSGRGALLS